MGTTSTVNGLPAPAGGDANNVPADIAALVAVLDTGSVVKRLSQAQINALTGPQKPAGLIVYNQTTGCIQMSNGSTFGDLPGMTPIGGGCEWYAATAPTGWLLCDGSAVSRTTYAALFALWGTTWGAGDGTTTFNLPDRRARVGVGYKAGDSDHGTLAGSGGSKTSVAPHTHAIDHNHAAVTSGAGSAHSHTLPLVGGTANVAAGGSYGVVTNLASEVTGAESAHTHSVDLPNYTGTSGAASAGVTSGNLQPYLNVNYIVRAL